MGIGAINNLGIMSSVFSGMQKPKNARTKQAGTLPVLATQSNTVLPLDDKISPADRKDMVEAYLKLFESHGIKLAQKDIENLLKDIDTIFEAIALKSAVDLLINNKIEGATFVNAVFNSVSLVAKWQLSVFSKSHFLSKKENIQFGKKINNQLIASADIILGKINPDLLNCYFNSTFALAEEFGSLIPRILELDKSPALQNILMFLLSASIDMSEQGVDNKLSQDTAGFFLLNSIRYLEINQNEVETFTQNGEFNKAVKSILSLSTGEAYLKLVLYENEQDYSITNVQALAEGIDTDESRVLFLDSIGLLAQNGFFGLQKEFPLDEIIRFSTDPEISKAYASAKPDKNIAFIIFGLKIPQKRAHSFFAKAGIEITAEIISQIDRLNRLEQTNILFGLFDNFTDQDSRKQNGLEDETKFKAFILACATDIANAAAITETTMGLIIDKNYRRIVLLSDAANYMLSTGEGNSVKDLESLIASLSTEQQELFFEIIQFFDFNRLEKHGSSTRIKDLYAFCKKDKNVQYYKSLATPGEKWAFVSQELQVDIENKQLTLEMGGVASLQGTISCSGSINVPLAVASLKLGFASYMAKSNYAFATKDPNLPNYSGQGHTLHALIERTDSLEKWGTITPTLGVKWSHQRATYQLNQSEVTGNLQSKEKDIGLVLGAKHNKTFNLGKIKDTPASLSLTTSFNLLPSLSQSFLGVDTSIRAASSIGIFNPFIALQYIRSSQTTNMNGDLFAYGAQSSERYTRNDSNKFNNINFSAGADLVFNENHVLRLDNTLTKTYVSGEASYDYLMDSVSLTYIPSISLGGGAMMSFPVGIGGIFMPQEYGPEAQFNAFGGVQISISEWMLE